MSSPPPGETVVIGVGNPIMGDDGLGVVALDRLRQRWSPPPSVQLVEGGTWGMNLLPLIEDAEQVMLLDAIDAGRPTGSLVVLQGDEVPRTLGLKLSPHQIDLREVLALAQLRGTLPKDLVAVGLQPGRIEMASELSPEVEARLDELLAVVIARLERWGVCPPAAGRIRDELPFIS
jgi:hydrogenase maturation protease